MSPRVPGTDSASHQTSTDRRRWGLLLLVALLTIAADQLTKAYVVANLSLHESWMPLDFVEPLFRFTHVHNTGAAFGMFPEGGMIFTVIALIVSVAIVYFYRQLPDGQWLFRLALGLQMGGALGNVIDRLRQGYVVDFLHFEYWPVFNVADSAVVVGVVLFAFEMWRLERRERREGVPSEQDAGHDRPSDEEVIYG